MIQENMKINQNTERKKIEQDRARQTREEKVKDNVTDKIRERKQRVNYRNKKLSTTTQPKSTQLS